MIGDQEANFGSETNEDDDIVVDMGGVDENASSFEALPRGMYNAVVDSVEYTKSKSGNFMWSWQFQIEDGEYAGRKLFYHSVFMEKTMPRVKKDILRVAPEILQGPFKPKQVADEGLLLGKRVKLQVDIRMYEGEKRNNVKQLLAPAAEGEGGGNFFPT